MRRRKVLCVHILKKHQGPRHRNLRLNIISRLQNKAEIVFLFCLVKHVSVLS